MAVTSGGSSLIDTSEAEAQASGGTSDLLICWMERWVEGPVSFKMIITLLMMDHKGRQNDGVVQ